MTALLQRDDAPAPGGPVPASPLVDAAVDAWIDPKYIKVTIVAAPLELGRWRLTATLLDWTDGFDTLWRWEATMVALPGRGLFDDPSGYTITEVPPPAPPARPVFDDSDDGAPA